MSRIPLESHESETIVQDYMNRRILVIGADGGIGKEVCNAFWDGGDSVVKYTREEMDLNILPLPFAFIDRLLDSDVVVNCAGYFGMDYDETMNVNFRFNWELIKLLEICTISTPLPFKAIIVGSQSYINPSGFWPLYSASKAALATIVQSSASVLFKNNVYLNLVNPPATDTPMRKKAVSGVNENWLVHPKEIADSIFRLSNSNRYGNIINL